MNPTSLLTGLGAAVGADPELGGIGTTTPGSPTTGDLFLSLVAGLLDRTATRGAAGPLAAAPAPAPAPGTPETTPPTAARSKSLFCLTIMGP